MSKSDQAIFAAGCFWGVQYYFDQVPGVVDTVVGYIGGNIDNPSYDQVCYGDTGHAEVVKVTFNSDELSYKTLLTQFFHMHDPTQLNRQGPDVGDQYRSAIFYFDNNQRALASEALEELNESQFKNKITTTLEPATTFWQAEEYHQKFTERTGRGMCHIPYRSIEVK